MNPEYPIYIVSKGRWKSRLTSKALEEMNVPYYIVVEENEYDNYASVIDTSKILKLPFSNLGQGSIPARNWIWEHSVTSGYDKHWIMDDNIRGFCRLNNNKRIPVKSGTIFKCCEDFVDRYENIAISGLQYRCFANNERTRPAFLLNTRIYSCLLIRNDIPFKWRGMYNEDTDLCLRVLKKGYCTILFQAFLQNKTGTMILKGGNTDKLYDKDGRMKMAQSLVDQHPDIVTITKNKWGRIQHLVDYTSFKNNKLKRKELTLTNTINNYGMRLIEHE